MEDRVMVAEEDGKYGNAVEDEEEDVEDDARCHRARCHRAAPDQ